MTRYLSLAASITALLLGLSFAMAQDTLEWTGEGWAQAAKPARGTPAGELALIRQYVQKGQAHAALKAVDEFMKKYATSAQAEEALMLGGQAEFNRGHYFQAFERYEKQLAQFPAGQYSERALSREYDIAEAFLAGKKRIVLGFLLVPAQDDGIMILKRIAEHAPGTAVADKALLRVGDYFYAKRRWPESIEGYDNYLKIFPKSEHAPYAMLQGARASLNHYRGPRYDETPLLEAQQRFGEFRTQFPGPAEKANVSQILDGIHQARARKQFATGEFYERTHKAPAAEFYYRYTADQYADTPYGPQAQARLGKVTPRAAAQRAATLTDLRVQGPAKAPAIPPATCPAVTTAPAQAPDESPATQPQAPIELLELMPSTTPAGEPAVPEPGPTDEPAPTTQEGTTQP